MDNIEKIANRYRNNDYKSGVGGLMLRESDRVALANEYHKVNELLNVANETIQRLENDSYSQLDEIQRLKEALNQADIRTHQRIQELKRKADKFENRVAEQNKVAAGLRITCGNQLNEVQGLKKVNSEQVEKITQLNGELNNVSALLHDRDLELSRMTQENRRVKDLNRLCGITEDEIHRLKEVEKSLREEIQQLKTGAGVRSFVIEKIERDKYANAECIGDSQMVVIHRNAEQKLQPKVGDRIAVIPAGWSVEPLKPEWEIAKEKVLEKYPNGGFHIRQGGEFCFEPDCNDVNVPLKKRYATGKYEWHTAWIAAWNRIESERKQEWEIAWEKVLSVLPSGQMELCEFCCKFHYNDGSMSATHVIPEKEFSKACVSLWNEIESNSVGEWKAAKEKVLSLFPDAQIQKNGNGVYCLNYKPDGLPAVWPTGEQNYFSAWVQVWKMIEGYYPEWKIAKRVILNRFPDAEMVKEGNGPYTLFYNRNTKTGSHWRAPTRCGRITDAWIVAAKMIGEEKPEWEVAKEVVLNKFPDAEMTKEWNGSYMLRYSQNYQGTDFSHNAPTECSNLSDAWITARKMLSL